MSHPPPCPRYTYLILLACLLSIRSVLHQSCRWLVTLSLNLLLYSYGVPCLWSMMPGAAFVDRKCTHVSKYFSLVKG